MEKESKLLTIYVPTYNRASLLEKNLKALVPQVEKYSKYCRLIVSDNCSLDSTESICSKFLNKIEYIKRDKNNGSASNFVFAFELKDVSYLWILGDDDIVTDNCLDSIITKILKNSYPFIYLNFSTLRKGLFYTKIKSKDDIIVRDKDKLYSLIGCDLTFISSSIINMKYFTNRQVLIDKKHDPFLQSYIYSCCINNNEDKLIVSETCFIIENNINTDYSMYKVFGKDLYNLTRFQINELEFNKKIVDKTYTKYLRKVVMPGLLGAKANNNKVMLNNFNDFYSSTKKYLISWIVFYPLLIIPNCLYGFAKRLKQFIDRIIKN